MSISVVIRQSQIDLNTKEVQDKEVRVAVEHNVANNLRVVGSTPDKDCPFYKIFKTAKTDNSYF